MFGMARLRSPVALNSGANTRGEQVQHESLIQSGLCFAPYARTDSANARALSRNEIDVFGPVEPPEPRLDHFVHSCIAG